jgi:hypothetical protein
MRIKDAKKRGEKQIQIEYTYFPNVFFCDLEHLIGFDVHLLRVQTHCYKANLFSIHFLKYSPK